MKRSRSSPDAAERSYVMHGDDVTHVLIPIDEWEKLIMRTLELEVIADLERDDEVEWIDIEDFAAQLAVDRLVKARKAKGLTQKKLAEKLGMPQSQISRIERNPDRTTIRTLKRIAKALGVDVSALV